MVINQNQDKVVVLMSCFRVLFYIRQIIDFFKQYYYLENLKVYKFEGNIFNVKYNKG